MTIKRSLFYDGFSYPKESYKKFVSLAEDMARRTGTNESGPKFACEESFVALSEREAPKNVRVLTIDVGGSHTRVALRETNAQGQEKWHFLFDKDNNDLQNHTRKGKGLSMLAAELAELVSVSLKRYTHGTPKLDGLGVVWSNKLKNGALPVKAQTIGVNGAVTGIGAGMSYRKGEWWNADLFEGDNVAGAFIDAFAVVGLRPRAFVIGNDTIFTCKAIPGANAGMVASTGANATIVPVGRTMLCNSECGGEFALPSYIFHKADDCGPSSVRLEDLMAGIGMPSRFAQHIICAAENGVAVLKDLGLLICEQVSRETYPITNEDLSKLLIQNEAEAIECFSRVKDQKLYSADVVLVLREMAKNMALRAGALAAVMAFISISNQTESGRHFKIALDSSQARLLPGYFAKMKESLNEILSERKCWAEILLAEPQGEISVPIMGVARAVDDFLER